jgi:hypothetical protein
MEARTCLKLGPAVKISWTRSSMERISYCPRDDSMTPMLVRGVRCFRIHACRQALGQISG